MSKAATREYTVGMRKRYRAMMTKRAKGKVLDEFCETTTLERKHAIKVLRSLHEPLRTAGRMAVSRGVAMQVVEASEQYAKQRTRRPQTLSNVEG